MISDVLDKAPVSPYQPSKEVADLTKLGKRDYQAGFDILHRQWEELNDYSVLDRDQKDKRTFNSFVDESVEDPNEAWKWRGTRSLARNKVMAMHAQTTTNYVVPRFYAQNEQDQTDRDASDVIDTILEHMTVNSNYRPNFMVAWMGALVSPATYLEADYCRVYQTIKEKTDEGYQETEVIDEVLSGFQANVLSVDQVYLSNAYEQDIQKQRGIVKVRYRDYYELEAKWGQHPNWQHVRPGLKCVFNDQDGLFYDVKDEDNLYLIEEATHFRRRDDLEVVYLNGIYFGNSNTDWNPIRHRDNRNAPKYNITPFGYERIGEHFFYFKSLVNRVGWDNSLIDAMYEVRMNRSFLDLEMPMAYSGFDKIDSSVVFPGAWISGAVDAKATPLLPPSVGGWREMQEIEASIDKASAISQTTEGQLPDASQKAYTVSQAAQNAKTLISGTLKILAESVRQYGALMVDIAVQHLTVPEVDELVDGVKYRTFVLSDQMVNGKKVSKRIRFDEAIAGMPKERVKEYQMKLLNEVGYPDNAEHLYVLNPLAFSKLKFIGHVEAEGMAPKNKEFEKAMAERLYGFLQMNPFVDLSALTRWLLNTEEAPADEIMSKQNMGALMPPQNPMMPQQTPNLPQKASQTPKVAMT